MEEVIKTTQEEVQRAKHVSIDLARLRDFSKEIANGDFGSWIDKIPSGLDDLGKEEKGNLFFLFNSISFSYWGSPRWAVTYHEKTFDRGSWSMIAALRRAFDEKKPIFDPNFLMRVDETELLEMLRGNTEIPLLGERVRILREIGRVVREKYSSRIENVYSKSADALELAKEILASFPSFRDRDSYSGREVFFNKRAQLAAADLTRIFDGRGLERLTACADYKLPLLLRVRGVLAYTRDLERKVDYGIEISAGSEEEVEIRASTIQAVERMKKLIHKTAVQINDYLWLEAGKIPRTTKYHLTRTTAY